MPAADTIELGGAARRPRTVRPLALGRLFPKASEAGLKTAHFKQPWLAAGLLETALGALTPLGPRAAVLQALARQIVDRRS